MGGNLLLDIGPMADGTIPTEQVKILEGLGRWTKKHEEAIYGSHAGIPKEYFSGPSTLSNDSTVLFLFLEYKPIGPIAIKGLKNKINRIRVVGNGTKLNWDIKMKQYWSSKPGMIYIDVPEEEVVKRIVNRRTCKQCGAVYHLIYAPPKEPNKCDKCGGELYQRDDDKEETVRQRFKVYLEYTAPLIDYYEKKGILSFPKTSKLKEHIMKNVKNANFFIPPLLILW